MRGAKCVYCGNEINAFELATCDINGKKKYCHTACHLEKESLKSIKERIKLNWKDGIGH